MGSAQARRKLARCTRDRQTACKINVVMLDLRVVRVCGCDAGDKRMTGRLLSREEGKGGV